NILDVVIKRNGIKSKIFEFQCEGITQKVLLQQIVYFRSDNKKIHIIMCSGEEKVFNGKLTDVIDKVPKTAFLQIHKSYLVNCDYVSEYTYECAKMVNNDILNISKAHRKDVKTALVKRALQ